MTFAKNENEAMNRRGDESLIAALQFRQLSEQCDFLWNRSFEIVLLCKAGRCG
jgi:hypothetical protein